MSAPAGAPYFTGLGQWDAYRKWNWTVPCQGCGKRKMDHAGQYGLQQLGHWPDCWVTEEWCNDCWWESDEFKGGKREQ